MPKREFALEEGGAKRLKLQWKGLWKNMEVTFDEQALGKIADQKALKSGAEFRIPDGRTLHVQLTTGMRAQLEVLLDGQPLPGSDSDPTKQIQTAAGIVYFVAGLSAAAGIAGLAGVDLLIEMGFGWPAIVAGGVFGALGVWIQKGHSKPAVIISMVLLALDGLINAWTVVDAGGQVPTGVIVMRVLFLIYMYPALKAIDTLRASS